MITLVELINLTVGTREFLFISEIISFLIKFFLISLLSYFFTKKNAGKHLFFLMVFIAGSMIEDLSYIIVLTQKIFLFEFSNIVTFILRLSWTIYISKHLSLGLFLEYLSERKSKFNWNYILVAIINIFVSGCFIYLAISKFLYTSFLNESLAVESTLIWLSMLTLLPLYLPILYRTIKKINSNKFPNILNHQLRIFVSLIVSYLSIELITNKHSIFHFISSFILINNKALLSIAALLNSYCIYYACRKLIGLRFLNFKNHVESPEKFVFINQFIDVLEQFTYVTNLKELAHITQNFFKSTFNIPIGRVRLYDRKDNSETIDNDLHPDLVEITNKVESFIIQANSESSLNQILLHEKILIRDEIAFTNFYEESIETQKILEFLENVNADIFLPIYEKQTIISYIIIEKNARINKLYSKIERDEMLVFSNYMSNIIRLLKHGNLDMMLQKEKEIKEELYQKHQEINQYKESMRSFLRTTKEKKIGIIFYKSRKFTFANQASKELFDLDINNHEGHQLHQAIKDLSRKVQEFKSPQNTFTHDNHGTKLVLSGIPSLESNTVIIIAYYPEISDIVKSQQDLLKDPSNWDYILYLETTKSGQLINQLIPGNSETLLNFKINLLTTALSRKATLLQMPEDDLLPTIEILHHISLRQNLHIIKLNAPEKNNEVAMKLFGINAIFGNSHEEALMKKLDNIGTIFIQNIDFLSIETQNHLASFITYGFYHNLKSDNKLFSNVRIIVSTTKNLQDLVTEGQFSKSLFVELKKASLTMPSLNSLAQEEIASLTDGFTQQTIKTQTFKNLLDLNDKEKDKIIDQRASSLQELKSKVQYLLIQKSTKHNIYDKTEIDHAYNTGDPQIALAVRLGKKALKDPQILSFLWQKFKNQNKIATLLGVNRSSVNRRCKEYNLY